MKQIKYIIVHCSDSSFGDAKLINEWHQERGWKTIGYHFVILNGIRKSNTFNECDDGLIEKGRPLDDDLFITGSEIGAHTLGLNDESIGICLIGKKRFTEVQLQALSFLLRELIDKYNIEIDNIKGHYETPQAHGKTCPNFDCNILRKMLKEDISLSSCFDSEKFNFC